MSDLANLEAGTAAFNKSALDLREILSEAVAALPPDGDHPIDIQLTTADGASTINGDAARLRTAFISILRALTRELVTSNQLLVRERQREFRGKPASWISIGDAEHITALESAAPDALATFDEWRGGCGLSLAVARRIVDGHGGAVWSPAQGTKAGAVVALPRL
jgi:signal transduction histidine kinase